MIGTSSNSVAINIPRGDKKYTISEQKILAKQMKCSVKKIEFEQQIQYFCEILKENLKSEKDKNTTDIAVKNLTEFATSYKEILKNSSHISALIENNIISLSLKENYSTNFAMNLYCIAISFLPSPLTTTINIFTTEKFQKLMNGFQFLGKMNFKKKNKENTYNILDKKYSFLQIIDNHILHLVAHLITERLDQLKKPDFFDKNKSVHYLSKIQTRLPVIEEDIDTPYSISSILTASALEGSEIYGVRTKEEAIELTKKYQDYVSEHLKEFNEQAEKISLPHTINADLNRLEEKVETLTGTIDTLKRDNTELKQKLKLLEEENEKRDKKLEELYEMIRTSKNSSFLSDSPSSKASPSSMIH